MAKLRPRWGFIQRVAMLMAVLVAIMSSGGVWSLTPEGTHCPTAPVQKIVSIVSDCCGRPIGTQVRAPKPGDREFVQCRCAEKRSAQQPDHRRAQTPPIVWISEAPPRWTTLSPEFPPTQIAGATGTFPVRNIEPPTHPPTA